MVELMLMLSEMIPEEELANNLSESSGLYKITRSEEHKKKMIFDAMMYLAKTNSAHTGKSAMEQIKGIEELRRIKERLNSEKQS